MTTSFNDGDNDSNSTYEDSDCPLCMEELDISDKNFKPCECGYQVCRFCWHHIRTELNGRCPACRRLYSEQNVQWRPVTAEEWKMDHHRKILRRQTDKEKKDAEVANRKHLANVRVIQRNLVYVNGLTAKNINDDLLSVLQGPEYFGQYGKITKLVLNKKQASTNNTIAVYITYQRKEDAARAIAAIDGSYNDGKLMRASYGTTKYCTSYLKNQACPNPGCMYLHEPGEELDLFSKDEFRSAQIKQNLQKLVTKQKTSSVDTSNRSENDIEFDSSALPATASWAKSAKIRDTSGKKSPSIIQSCAAFSERINQIHANKQNALLSSMCEISCSDPSSLTTKSYKLLEANMRIAFDPIFQSQSCNISDFKEKYQYFYVMRCHLHGKKTEDSRKQNIINGLEENSSKLEDGNKYQLNYTIFASKQHTNPPIYVTI